MGGGFQLFDIVLFAVLALFLIFKLGSVLGRRGEDEQKQTDPFRISPRETSAPDNVVVMPERPTPTEEELAMMDPLEAGLAQIKAADRSFRESDFVKGARMAFEMTLEAFAKGERKTLKSLLDKAVYENFEGAMRQREQAGHELETTIVGIEESQIVGAKMDGDLARVTVKFVTEQVNALRNSAGEVIEGDPSAVVKVTDIWTFTRNTRSSNPNWLLVATGSED